MRVSAKGLAFLSREEGCVLRPYNDSAGHATIGVGHLIHHGRVTAADNRRYAGFTRADAIRLLKSDVKSREEFVSRAVKVPLTQNQFDALVSLVFNIGTGGFASSTVLRKLNAKDYKGAAEAFLMWHRGGRPFELLPRRKREKELFLSGAAVQKTDPLAVLTKTEKRWVVELDRLRAQHKNVERRKALVVALTKQRKAVYAAAEKHGWDKENRKARYRILKSRTT